MYGSAASLDGARVLPRGDILVIGGDLAYPNPSNETYEKRLFRCRHSLGTSAFHAVLIA